MWAGEVFVESRGVVHSKVTESNASIEGKACNSFYSVFQGRNIAAAGKPGPHTPPGGQSPVGGSGDC